VYSFVGSLLEEYCNMSVQYLPSHTSQRFWSLDRNIQTPEGSASYKTQTIRDGGNHFRKIVTKA